MGKFKNGMLTCFFIFCSAWVNAKDWTTIRIGLEASYPPFSMKTPGGQLTGFDVDIAQALCAQMKAKCTFVEGDFDGLIAGLNVRKFDAIISSLAITETRKKAVAFTDPYYRTPTRIIAKNNTTDGSIARLKGKKMGVLRGSSQHWYAKDIFAKAGVIIVPYTNQNEAFLDLKSGRVETMLSDVAQGQYSFLKRPEGKGFGFVGPIIQAPLYFDVGMGIAIRKADNDLRLQFNQALKAIRANGVYKKVQDKYFDFNISAN